MTKKINIELSQEQILVLGDLLYRINSKKILDSFFEDQAEQRVLWDLEWIMEKNTTSIFSSNYLDMLKKARDLVRDKD